MFTDSQILSRTLRTVTAIIFSFNCLGCWRSQAVTSNSAERDYAAAFAEFQNGHMDRFCNKLFASRFQQSADSLSAAGTCTAAGWSNHPADLEAAVGFYNKATRCGSATAAENLRRLGRPVPEKIQFKEVSGAYPTEANECGYQIKPTVAGEVASLPVQAVALPFVLLVLPVCVLKQVITGHGNGCM